MKKKENLSIKKKKIENKFVYLKIHSSENINIYAFSDQELIGKTLKLKELSFFVSPKFYEGELIPLSQALNLLNNQINSNIVGRLAYYAAKLNIISPRSIFWFKIEMTEIKIPHAITMRT